MSTSKTAKIGSVFLTKDRSGADRFSIGLGVKGKNPDYDLSVELVVKDRSGKVVARQTDGFINLVDPRTQPDELLSRGLVTEEVAGRMKEQVSKIPEKIRFQLTVPRSS